MKLNMAQLAPAETTAAVAVEGERPGPSGFSYFLIAVAAGLTIWWLTRYLDGSDDGDEPEEENEEDLEEEEPAPRRRRTRIRTTRGGRIQHDDDGGLEGA